MCSAIWSIFTARCYAKRGTCRRRVSVRPSVSLYVCVCVCLQMGCFVVAEFLQTSASRGPSAIAQPLVDILGPATVSVGGHCTKFDYDIC